MRVSFIKQQEKGWGSSLYTFDRRLGDVHAVQCWFELMFKRLSQFKPWNRNDGGVKRKRGGRGEGEEKFWRRGDGNRKKQRKILTEEENGRERRGDRKGRSTRPESLPNLTTCQTSLTVNWGNFLEDPSLWRRVLKFHFISLIWTIKKMNRAQSRGFLYALDAYYADEFGWNRLWCGVFEVKMVSSQLVGHLLTLGSRHVIV